jgi:hypothetical protein
MSATPGRSPTRSPPGRSASRSPSRSMTPPTRSAGCCKCPRDGRRDRVRPDPALGPANFADRAALEAELGVQVPAVGADQVDPEEAGDVLVPVDAGLYRELRLQRRSGLGQRPAASGAQLSPIRGQPAVEGRRDVATAGRRAGRRGLARRRGRVGCPGRDARREQRV